MGTECVHYAVLGVALTSKNQVSGLLQYVDDIADAFDKYEDNPYKQEITETESGIRDI
jgi:hypothetical protein